MESERLEEKKIENLGKCENDRRLSPNSPDPFKLGLAQKLIKGRKNNLVFNQLQVLATKK